MIGSREMMRFGVPLRRSVVVVALAILLSACGGGTTNSTRPTVAPPPAPPPPPTDPLPPPSDPNDFRTAEFGLSWGLEAIGAADAYAAGFTGAGVTVGVFDFNFDFSSSELDFHAASRDRDPFNVSLYEAQIGGSATTDQHGQAVAVIAAGIKNGQETHGVAFDAKLLAVDFFSGVNDQHVTQNGVLLHISDPWTYMTDLGARVINKSLGFDEQDIIQNPPVVSEAYVIEFDTFAVAGGALLVASAGNDGEPDPMLSNLETITRLSNAGLLDSGPGAFIIAGAVDQNNQIAFFSDRAGTARDHYLVAPGVDVIFPWNGQRAVGSGTSFSAPHITGAAAILVQRWPNLTARDVRDILFQSATDLGAPGVDAIYGHGLVNLAAALQPLGTASLATVTGVQPLVSDSAIVLSSAFGDAGALGNALSSIMMLDGFGRDFRIDMSGFVQPRAALAPLDAIVTQRRNWRGSSRRMAGLGQVNLMVGQDSREQALLPLMGQAAQGLDPAPDVILEFAGRIAGAGKFKGVSWRAGSGRQLGEALAPRPRARSAGGLLSLTRAFAPVLNTGRGGYAVAGWWLDQSTELKLGASLTENSGFGFHPVEALRPDVPVVTLAARLDRHNAASRLAVEAGILVEDGALLGSRAAGGLALAGKARTGWLRLEAERNLGARFSLSAAMALAVSEPGAGRSGLLQSIGAITSSSFSARLAGRDLLRRGDAGSLTIHQPLRVERSRIMLVSGRSLDPATGDVIFAERGLSLAPSGREIALEAAYRAGLGAGSWLLEANIAYRFDADHVAGRRDAIVLLGLGRDF